MAIELKVPSVGESITEVQIGRWHKAEGDPIAKDETLVEIETDKVTVELPAPSAGTLGKILKQTGEPSLVGDVIGYVEAGDGAAAGAPAKPAAPKATAAPAAKAPSKTEAAPATPAKASEGESAKTTEAKPAEAKPVAPKPALAKAPATGGADRAEEVVPMTPMRRRIAERLVQAQQTTASLTTFNEVDMTGVMALRTQLQEAFVARHGVKLGFMSFFVRAVVHGLRAVPQVNAEVRGTDIVYHHYCDVGIAIGGGKGLVVPVLRNAERMGFAEIELKIAEYAARAKENKIELSELQGGTFTITNGGIYGSVLSTPILNTPQSGILGMHAIQDRAVVRDKQVVVRPIMNVALTYDHRIVDGREAVTFLKMVKEVIEEPARMLIEV